MVNPCSSRCSRSARVMRSAPCPQPKSIARHTASESIGASSSLIARWDPVGGWRAPPPGRQTARRLQEKPGAGLSIRPKVRWPSTGSPGRSRSPCARSGQLIVEAPDRLADLLRRRPRQRCRDGRPAERRIAEALPLEGVWWRCGSRSSPPRQGLASEVEAVAVQLGQERAALHSSRPRPGWARRIPAAGCARTRPAPAAAPAQPARRSPAGNSAGRPPTAPGARACSRQ